ncbi:myc-associated zinc finger protein isoform X2 [Sphaerodactylus townsendi]|uniref:myc-associated zinc finger protein isoform X2 n=1 Tax=Sphaerodactylus townsendi TaxID=933632 RepID=UPI002025F7B6|nr:myc-associated zinc finger protein isoform X2 [Sphaerodactylus townsendi]
MDPSNWSSFIFQSHTQNPLQVGAEIQSRFFAAQGCSQSPFQDTSTQGHWYSRLPAHSPLGTQTATTAPPQQSATPAESLQVDLLPVLAAAQETAAAAAVVAAATASAPTASTVDTAALKQQQPSASEGGGGHVAPTTQTTQAPTPQAAPATPQPGDSKKPKSKGPYICSLCAKEFKNGYNLRRHEAIHTGAKASRAGPTTMKMPTMVPLSLLSVSAIGGTTPATPGPTEGAGNTTGSGAGLVTTTASGKRIRKNHACEMCGKAFRDVYHLNRHKLSHSDEKPYQCPVCQQRFKRKDRMSYHVRSHDGAVHKPYICSHCGKSFSRPDHLNSHVRQVHSTERPFKCERCEAAFATKDRLRAHTVRHEEKVPCHVCGKMLSSAYITDHMKVHSQGPNHVCELCNKGFTTAAYLRVHAVKDHGLAAPRLERFLCKLCGVHCKTPAQLNGHLQTHAGEGAAATEGQPLR